MLDFNSHAHVERDCELILDIYERMDFNSHAHVERDETRAKKIPRHHNFNSHAHVERDNPKLGTNMYKFISTHTLTWSVTADRGKITPEQYISTHTLTWSVTLDVVYIWCLLNVMRTYFFI